MFLRLKMVPSSHHFWLTPRLSFFSSRFHMYLENQMWRQKAQCRDSFSDDGDTDPYLLQDLMQLFCFNLVLIPR